MKDIDKSAYYHKVIQHKEKNNAGEYEIIRNATGVQDVDSRLYYRTYIPASLQQVDGQQLLTDEWKHRLKFIYREIGKMQGLSFYETDFRVKNRQLYKQECISVLESDDIKVQLTDVFCPSLSEDICRKMVLYECVEEHKDCICDIILQGKIKIKHQSVAFRKNQIWENTKFKKVSLLEYNPPTPEQVSGLMRDLEAYWKETIKIDDIIKSGLLAYQFLTIMPYKEDNEIWISILLNFFMRHQGMGSDYYIPFARYFLEQDAERKIAMRQVRESGDYGIWIRFFIHVVEMAVAKTNQAIMRLEQIHKNTLISIQNEKQKSLLQEVSVFIEENPVFVIYDIEQEFQISYNTAAKSVAILEKYDLVKEISNKQRYRVYCYEHYLKEIIK
ncbi:MAG: hypothetical protein HDT39_13995 [Lachnospiraceae bacterium]|nr:hypothetical protein [Lachnospiraceae bacterium]